MAARQASLSITNSQSSLRLMSIESVMPSSHLILCRPLLLLPPSLPIHSNVSSIEVEMVIPPFHCHLHGNWIIEKAKEFQKNMYFCFIDYAKAFDCVNHNKLWKILQEMGMPDHLTCLLRNLHADQEARVRIGHGTTDWFQIEKGLRQGCILSP